MITLDRTNNAISPFFTEGVDDIYFLFFTAQTEPKHFGTTVSFYILLHFLNILQNESSWEDISAFSVSLSASSCFLFFKFPLSLKERGQYFHGWALVSERKKKNVTE